MTEKKLTTLIGAFMTFLGVVLGAIGLEITEETWMAITGGAIALAGVIFNTIGPSVNPKKPGPGALNLLIAAIILGPVLAFAPGCSTIERIWESPTVKRVVSISLSAIAAKQAADNPEYAWAIEGLATYLKGIDQARPPDAFSQALETWILRNVDDPTMRNRLQGEIAETANSAYAELYAEFGDSISDTQLVEIIKAMGLAIESGTKPPSVDAGETAYVVETATLRVEIR